MDSNGGSWQSEQVQPGANKIHPTTYNESMKGKTVFLFKCSHLLIYFLCYKVSPSLATRPTGLFCLKKNIFNKGLCPPVSRSWTPQSFSQKYNASLGQGGIPLCSFVLSTSMCRLCSRTIHGFWTVGPSAVIPTNLNNHALFHSVTGPARLYSSHFSISLFDNHGNKNSCDSHFETVRNSVRYFSIDFFSSTVAL
jgi:hypothetical protein